MSILEAAKQHAIAKAAHDPERLKAIEARRAMIEQETAQLYARLEPLAGQLIRYGDKQGRLHVSLMPTVVNIAVTEREQYQAGDGSIRYRDTRKQLAQATARSEEDRLVFREFGGADKPFSQHEDLERHVAKVIGEMLVLEE